MGGFLRFLGWTIGLIAVLLAGLIAYGAATSPSIPRAALEAKYATPPSQFAVLPDGARAHYRDRGDKAAPVLILIHGSNASLYTWEPWANELSNSYRVISVDLPGHGLTGAVPNGDYSQEGMTEFVREFADKLGIKTFTLAGNSMGGGVAARFAEEFPERLTALILVDAAGMRAGKWSGGFLYSLARTPGVNQLLRYVTPRSLAKDGLNEAVVRKSIISDAMIDRYWEFARMEGTREATIKRFSLPRDEYVAQHIQDIKAPVLILWGEEDHVIPVASAHRFHAAIKGSKLIIYPATGHIPMEEVASQSAGDVRAFLQSLKP